MHLNNSILTHFLSFVCVFESKVPRHAFLGAAKKHNFWSRWRLVNNKNNNRNNNNNFILFTEIQKLNSLPCKYWKASRGGARQVHQQHNYLVKTKAFNLVTESYSRDRGKQNGAIVTIFSLITIVVFKSRKEVVIKAFLNSRMFSSGVFIVSLALIRSCV